MTNVNDIELLALSVRLGATKLYVTCSYIPPSSDFVIYEMHLDTISDVSGRLSDRDSLLIFASGILAAFTSFEASDSFISL